ncbi:hypothetical protein SAMN05216226_1361 [Halovenus aranensis]|uniref:Uncharacterized protein n=1 Tax=Halovenus aranensis TaxID=890420 RepID=A0A1G8ZU39_9EURY|nr:hypothetical protein [Halovenus aranensis]SDK18642.1 hypothetical protein SAMN05216226_1361 [Halovenus aranensis]
MSNEDTPSFRTRGRSIGSDGELSWGGNEGNADNESWNDAIEESNGITITEDGTIETGSEIPDSVTSRPDDDSSNTGPDEGRGLVVNPNSDFGKFGAVISNNTSGVTRARLYDYSQSTYVESVDISGLSSGDAFVFETDVVSGTDYGVELDDSGDSYTLGFYGGADDFPFTGDDFDIIAQSQDGVQSTSAAPQAVNDVGNSGL